MIKCQSQKELYTQQQADLVSGIESKMQEANLSKQSRLKYMVNALQFDRAEDELRLQARTAKVERERMKLKNRQVRVITRIQESSHLHKARQQRSSAAIDLKRELSM